MRKLFSRLMPRGEYIRALYDIR